MRAGLGAYVVRVCVAWMWRTSSPSDCRGSWGIASGGGVASLLHRRLLTCSPSGWGRGAERGMMRGVESRSPLRGCLGGVAHHAAAFGAGVAFGGRAEVVGAGGAGVADAVLGFGFGVLAARASVVAADGERASESQKRRGRMMKSGPGEDGLSQSGEAQSGTSPMPMANASGALRMDAPMLRAAPAAPMKAARPVKMRRKTPPT